MKLAFETKVKVVFEIIKAKLGFSSLCLTALESGEDNWRHGFVIEFQ